MCTVQLKAIVAVIKYNMKMYPQMDTFNDSIQCISKNN